MAATKQNVSVGTFVMQGHGITTHVMLSKSNYNRTSDVAVRVCVCGNQLLEWLMSPSTKSQVMFASGFS